MDKAHFKYLGRLQEGWQVVERECTVVFITLGGRGGGNKRQAAEEPNNSVVQKNWNI